MAGSPHTYISYHTNQGRSNIAPPPLAQSVPSQVPTNKVEVNNELVLLAQSAPKFYKAFFLPPKLTGRCSLTQVVTIRNRSRIKLTERERERESHAERTVMKVPESVFVFFSKRHTSCIEEPGPLSDDNKGRRCSVATVLNHYRNYQVEVKVGVVSLSLLHPYHESIHLPTNAIQSGYIIIFLEVSKMLAIARWGESLWPLNPFFRFIMTSNHPTKRRLWA